MIREWTAVFSYLPVSHIMSRVCRCRDEEKRQDDDENRACGNVCDACFELLASSHVYRELSLGIIAHLRG